MKTIRDILMAGMKPGRPTFVLYHEDADGFGAAFAAWRFLGDSERYIAVNYGEPLPEIPDMSNVFILDFSYDAQTLCDLAMRSALVQVIDHHKTAREELEKLPDSGFDGRFFKIFDMEHSGAVLAWNYFMPEREVPKLLLYVEDRDLWRFQLPNSREINAALNIEPWDFNRWHVIEDKTGMLIEPGKANLMLITQTAKRAAKKAVSVTWDGYMAKKINCTAFISETCHAMLEIYPEAKFVAAYFDNEYGKRVWSLRCRPDFDVSAIAKRYGGGGHPQAAGFEETL